MSEPGIPWLHCHSKSDLSGPLGEARETPDRDPKADDGVFFVGADEKVDAGLDPTHALLIGKGHPFRMPKSLRARSRNGACTHG